MAITPHGGTLVNRFVAENTKASLLREAQVLPRIRVDAYAAFDIDGIAKGISLPAHGVHG